MPFDFTTSEQEGSGDGAIACSAGLPQSLGRCCTRCARAQEAALAASEPLLRSMRE